MSRYIDANMLKDKTTRINHIWNCTTNAEGKGLGEIIDDIPTADVVEVVRCKDCKYNVKGDSESEFWNICTLRPRLYVPVSDEDYCSRGEKKDEGEGAVT